MARAVVDDALLTMIEEIDASLNRRLALVLVAHIRRLEAENAQLRARKGMLRSLIDICRRGVVPRLALTLRRE